MCVEGYIFCCANTLNCKRTCQVQGTGKGQYSWSIWRKIKLDISEDTDKSQVR
jgi:hypothetical protein